MELKPGYKQTEVGVIPEDWEIKPLHTMLRANPKYGINAPAVKLEGDLPVYIRITDISDEGYFAPSEKVGVDNKFSDSYYLEDGDLVFTRTGASVGKSYLYNPTDGKLVYAGFLIKISPNKEKLFPSYLAQFVKTSVYWNWVRVMSMRSGQPGINGNEYGQLLIPLPPTRIEQAAIANALRDADALIQSLTRLIAKKRQIKQGAMQTLLNPYENGRLKAGWVVKSLGRVAEFINGRAYSLSEWENYGTPVIRLQNLTGRGDEFYYSNLKLPEKQYCIAGDLLFMWSATFGPVIWQGEKAIYHYHIWKIECKPKEIDKMYLYFILDELTERLKRSSSNGGTMLHVTKEKMESIEIHFPPVEEQTRIATILSDMDAEIAALETKLAKYRRIKQGMMQNLLTGRIRLI
ncbi:conserved hypothetical protein [Nitrosomonas nitrosa]|uniref:Type I restriction modification DNA specificity domain-containing protein n=1 Tax=Nitrosomonas nitrosa TaxID=52442 RepID=A0A8H9DCI9_9PROT|nr:restriction endonuclease subunit S [Nitrosomonas nitrosa]CAE6517429.1 conserved hypothetical protein [Nitrosomonas nitrosa]